MEAVRAKSVRQSELFIALVEQELDGRGFTLASPRDPARRGSQVCLRHQHAWPISQALIAAGVVGDFRAPDVLRLGFTPLYLGYAELWDAIAALRNIMQQHTWDQPQFHAPAKVT
jgi:kynureninase